jgi:prepilin peptidase CpaA
MARAGSLDFLHLGVLALAAIFLIAAAVWDARNFRIPNLLSLALLLLFPAFVSTAPATVAWGQHLAVAGLVLGAGFILYTKKIIGAGDVKLLSVASLWAGPDYLDLLLLIMAIAGGLLAVATAGVTFYRRRKAKSSATASLRKERIPYGVAIAVGGLCTLIVLYRSVPFS